MKTEDKAALLAAFDLSPGSAYDNPGALRSLAASQPEAAPVLLAIEWGAPLETIREAIAALPTGDAPEQVQQTPPVVETPGPVTASEAAQPS
jgi:hypothetical protein